MTELENQSLQGLRIYIFVESYPNPYKPYYDHQFADLLKKGHDVRIFAAGSAREVLNPKVRDYRLDQRTRRYYPNNLRNLPRFAPSLLRAFLRDPSFWARHARQRFNGERLLKSAMKEIVRMASLPFLTPDVCFVHGLGPMIHLSWLRELYPNVPVALYHHGGRPDEAGGPLPAAAVRKAFQSPHIIFTNTEYSRSDAVARGADFTRVRVLPVGFDLDEYTFETARPYLVGDVLRLISVGRLSTGKGQLTVLTALLKLSPEARKRIRYTLVGDGPMRSQLESFIREHRLQDQVHLLGTLTNHEVLGELQRNDALILPSIPWHDCIETQAAVVQEAALTGALVLTSRTGGVPESTPPAMLRFSFNPGNIDEIASILKELVDMSRDEMKRLGRQAREWAQQVYDIRTLNDRMLSDILTAGTACGSSGR